MSAPERRYWDSNCFIAWLKGEEGRADACNDVLATAYKGGIVIVTSAITLAEVVRPTQKGPRVVTEELDAKIHTFFTKSPFLHFVDVHPGCASVISPCWPSVRRRTAPRRPEP